MKRTYGMMIEHVQNSTSARKAHINLRTLSLTKQLSRPLNACVQRHFCCCSARFSWHKAIVLSVTYSRKRKKRVIRIWRFLSIQSVISIILAVPVNSIPPPPCSPSLPSHDGRGSSNPYCKLFLRPPEVTTINKFRQFYLLTYLQLPKFHC